MKTILRRAILSAGGALLLLCALGATDVMALPKEGDVAPNARVDDADDHAFELKSLKGKAFVIVYDDKDSAPTSAAFRKELVKVAKGDGYKGKVGLVIVADVAAYNFWPAKGVVKDAVRKETSEQGTTVYCDWTSNIRSAYNLRGPKSNIVLVGKDGRVLFAAEGAPEGANRKKFFELLRAQVGA